MPAPEQGVRFCRMVHVRAQPGTRIEETARLMEQIEQTVRATIRAMVPAPAPDRVPGTGVALPQQNGNSSSPEPPNEPMRLRRR